MPEVKWVYLSKNLVTAGERYVGETDYTPVLTLDQIEAWLTAEPVDNAYKRHFKEALLAQVRAWKEGQ